VIPQVLPFRFANDETVEYRTDERENEARRDTDDEHQFRVLPEVTHSRHPVVEKDVGRFKPIDPERIAAIKVGKF
jgi:hypothetical protein